MWLVIHIPKTAGTSLRWALEKQFGKAQIVWDYGPASNDTSDIVREYLYENPHESGSADLVKKLSEGDTKVLIGHFPFKKYADYFEPGRIITFVRDPLIRICSEYLHRIDNGTFIGSFSDYLQKPGSQNLQSWFLEDVSGQMVIGITEQYRSSLNYINHVFGWNLKARKKNVAWFKGGKKFAEKLSVQELDLFQKLNETDISLYHKAKQGFESNK